MAEPQTTTDPLLTIASASSAAAATQDPKDSPSTQSQGQSSPKRKAEDAGSSVVPDSTTNSSGDGKKKRRKVNHACVYCRRSHMTCDLERPCARCVKRDIGHLCHDEPREPPKRSKSELVVAELAPAPGDGLNGHTAAHLHGNGAGSGIGNGNGNGMSLVNGVSQQAQLAQTTTISPANIQRSTPQTADSTAGFLQNVDWNNNGVQSQFQDMHHLHPNYMFNHPEVTNEYNLLNDFLSSSIMEDGAMYTDSNTEALFEDPLLATSAMVAHVNDPDLASLNSTVQSATTSNAGPQQRPPSQPMQPPSLPTPQVAPGQDTTRPSSTYQIDSRARDKFYMTAADPAGLSSAEDRLQKLLKAKYDAGMLKPFNYVRGYARLNQYMSKHVTRASQLRILKQLDRFRPKFREAMQSLTDMQLVLVEMWFERSLMEYDRVFASMAIPACCWRRTGEIFRGNAEMAELVRVPVSHLRDGKMAMHEIVKEDSLVSYWEKFGAIAFDQSQKAILTSCTLMRPAKRKDDGDGDDAGKEQKEKMEAVRCCFSFTIRRDTHNM